jgi:hypothetical protein
MRALKRRYEQRKRQRGSKPDPIKLDREKCIMILSGLWDSGDDSDKEFLMVTPVRLREIKLERRKREGVADARSDPDGKSKGRAPRAAGRIRRSDSPFRADNETWHKIKAILQETEARNIEDEEQAVY